MTYRRFFHILLIGSTLVLAGVWWSSHRTTRAFTSATYRPLCTLQAHLFQGHIGLFWENTPHAGWLYDFRSSTFGLYTPSDDTQPGLLGIFRWYDTTETSPFGPSRAIGILFPVWVPWILFIVSSFAFCRVMERRSGKVKEKELAGKFTAATLEQIPD